MTPYTRAHRIRQRLQNWLDRNGLRLALVLYLVSVALTQGAR